MACPPTKRLRSLDHAIPRADDFNDPFGDDEEFSQADLDQIDIIASQAFSAVSGGAGPEARTGTKAVEHLGHGSGFPSSAAQSKANSRTASTSNVCSFVSKRGDARGPSREPLGKRENPFGSGRDEAYDLLEAQHADLRRKLKEVEDEILLKSGEIRVLRDSLKAAQQDKDSERNKQLQLEAQRQREHSDREKELNRKVQSLQSELQFKEAEINEMKTKLHNSDKNKTASPLQRSSPKVLNSFAQLHHGSGSGSPSPTASGFITKETFGAQLPSKMTPVKTPAKSRRENRTSSSSRSADRQEAPPPDPFLSVRPAPAQHPGGVLLGLLLQQPLSPSSLCLSHLLAINLTDIHSASSRLSVGSVPRTDAMVGVCGAGGSLSPIQSLAQTGLNMLTQSRPGALANLRSCPGAVLLLPLLDFLLSRLCQALDASPSSSSSAGSGAASSAATSSHPAAARSAPGLRRPGEVGLMGFSMEDAGLAALRVLYLLLAHSDEVVEALLSNKSPNNLTENTMQRCPAGVAPHSQNALLRSVLQLCDAGLGRGGAQREELAASSLKTLRVLMERAPHTHSDRLQCVLRVVCGCVSADARLSTVSECVSVLMCVCDHPALVGQLCSLHDPCVFLKLFQFIRNRPVHQESHVDPILLDLQVVRLLIRLTQTAESWISSQHSSCQCHTEVVQIVVIVLHRQWLELCDSASQADSNGGAPWSPWWRGPAASLLRESLQLLHWLLLNHGSFSESCRPLMHMYDQVIPAVRDTLRRIPDLSESEELVLEEICRSEGDDTDDMDTDAAP